MSYSSIIILFISNTDLEIQFGAGTLSVNDETIIPNPNNVGIGISDGRNELERAYDPSNFLYTGTYGKVPNNTTLTVTYLVGGGIGANVTSNTITNPETIFTVTKPNLNPNTNRLANFPLQRKILKKMIR